MMGRQKAPVLPLPVSAAWKEKNEFFQFLPQLRPLFVVCLCLTDHQPFCVPPFLFLHLQNIHVLHPPSSMHHPSISLVSICLSPHLYSSSSPPPSPQIHQSLPFSPNFRSPLVLSSNPSLPPSLTINTSPPPRIRGIASACTSVGSLDNNNKQENEQTSKTLYHHHTGLRQVEG